MILMRLEINSKARDLRQFQAFCLPEAKIRFNFILRKNHVAWFLRRVGFLFRVMF